ncbi:MAG: hypothetical protein VB049_02285 [Candidatus Pelethousia sp.]|nr:hypothetical protein [Candidatus Pelethousia sp.]
MHSLAHQKANALSAMKTITEEVVSRLEKGGEDEAQFAGILQLLDKRSAYMEAVGQLDKRFAFLQDSGYEPQAEETRRISLEQDTIRALLTCIQTLDEQGIRTLEQARCRLMESIKEVKDGRKSIQAYAPVPEEEEGRRVDTLR